MQEVKLAIQLIENYYIEPVAEPRLVDGCLVALRRMQLVDSAKAVWVNPLDAVSDALERAEAKVPGRGRTVAAGECIRGMVSTLDMRAGFLDEEDYRELKLGKRGLAEPGLRMVTSPAGLRVLPPVPNSSAQGAGIVGGEILLRIDNREVDGMMLRDIVHVLRGAVGTTVTLTLQRQGDAQPWTVTLTREAREADPVLVGLAAPGIGYLLITHFSERTPEYLVTALRVLEREQDSLLSGIILDLRLGTPGRIDSSVAVAATFLPEGATFGELRGRNSTATLRCLPEDYMRAGERDPLKQLPEQVKTVNLAVLVGEQSGPGAEAVAAVLQDHKRAVLIGGRTRGGGPLLSMLSLRGIAALALPTGQLFRPRGDRLQDSGATPEIVVDKSSQGSESIAETDTPRSDPVILKAIEVLQRMPKKQAPLRSAAYSD